MSGRAIRSDALTLLELEHHRLEQVLAALENALPQMDQPNESKLVHEALVYLREYPDACHHPKEDLIEHRMRLRQGNTKGAMNVEHEHEVLHELTVNALRAVEGQSDGESLRAVLRNYVADYRKHIAEENDRFFPLALSTLSRDDFDEIDFQVFDAPDPVFDRSAEERFAALRTRLVQSADQSS